MMVHTFSALGQYLAADVNSGAVHVLDRLSYDLLNLLDGPVGEGRGVPPELLEKLPQYAPEQVRDAWEELRELQNAVEYAANLCSEEVLTPKDLPGHLAAAHSADTPREPPEESSEEQLLRELLIRYGYTLEGKKLIAAHMGFSLRTLYRRPARFQIC